jgi:hypothetical protein
VINGVDGATIPMKPSVEVDDLPNLYNELAIFDNAKVLAQRIAIPEPLLRFLYSRSRWRPMTFEEWSHAVRVATAIDHILEVAFRIRLGRFNALIENRDALETLPPGTLLVSIMAPLSNSPVLCLPMYYRPAFNSIADSRTRTHVGRCSRH